MDNTQIHEATLLVIKTIKGKQDAFLVLCSLNLLNAAVKQEEFKSEVKYALIKPAVVKFIRQCLNGKNIKYVDDIQYDNKGQCIYVRCYGIQFSFHNIGEFNLNNAFLESQIHKTPVWDGIRLQPIACKLFEIAKKMQQNHSIDPKSIFEEIT